MEKSLVKNQKLVHRAAHELLLELSNFMLEDRLAKQPDKVNLKKLGRRRKAENTLIESLASYLCSNKF